MFAATLLLAQTASGQTTIEPPAPATFDVLPDNFTCNEDNPDDCPNLYFRLTWTPPSTTVPVTGYSLDRRIYHDGDPAISTDDVKLEWAHYTDFSSSVTYYEDRHIPSCSGTYYYRLRTKSGSSLSEPIFASYWIGYHPPRPSGCRTNADLPDPPRPQADPETDSETNRKAHQHAHYNAYSDSLAYAHGESHADTYGDRYSYYHCDSDCESHADRLTHSDCESYANNLAHSDCESHADRVADSVGHANHHPIADSDRDAYDYSHPNSNRYTDDHPNSDRGCHTRAISSDSHANS